MRQNFDLSSLLWILLGALYLIPTKTICQGENNLWYIGNQAAIDFRNGEPELSQGNLLSSNAMVTISDSTGNLLFYTNGQEVYDRNNDLMPFSGGLGADPASPQSVAVTPVPANSSQYYIFTVSPDSEGAKLRYSVLDMELNEGNGAIVLGQKNILLGDDFEQLLVTTPAPCGVWVIAQKKDVFNASVFYSFLVDFRGVDVPVISSHGIVFNTGGTGFDNLLVKFSPTKDQLVVTGTYEPGFGGTSTEDFLSLFFFNRNEGRAFEHLVFESDDIFQNVKGSCFSPDGNLLYTTENDEASGKRAVFQYDISENDREFITNSRTLIGIPSCDSCLADMQLGPNDKIYIAKENENYLASIEQPNLIGTASNFVDESVSLGNATSRKGLQNKMFNAVQINGIFNFSDSVICDLDTIILSPSSNFQDLMWQDGSTAMNYEITEPGIYWVNGVFGECPVRDSVNILEFSEELDLLGNDTIICHMGELNYDLDGNNVLQYTWSDGSNGSTFTILEPGLYSVEATDGSCQFFDEVEVDFYKDLDLGPDTTLCQGERLVLNPGFDNSNYLWSDGSTENLLIVQAPGVYTVDLLIGGTCIETDEIQVNYSELQQIILGPDTTLCRGETYTLSVEDQNANYLWQDGSNENALIVDASGSYALTVSDSFCSSSDEVQIRFQNCCNTYIPNAFSPNDDGFNDEFRVFSTCDIASFSLKIFDRFGHLYFETDSLTDSWTGKFNELEANPAVFVYFVEITNSDATTEFYNGDVVLIK